MRNLIYLITLTTILSLIGCNGLLGQVSGSGQVEKESNLDFAISNSLEKEVNEMNDELKNEFNQLINNGKDLVREIGILENEINNAKTRAENLENLNKKMTTRSEDSQSEIDLLIISNKDLIAEFDNINIELDQTRKLINLTQDNIINLDQYSVGTPLTKSYDSADLQPSFTPTYTEILRVIYQIINIVSISIVY